MQNFSSFHFIGIGGVSMSGIAIELSKQGAIVSGSDLTTSQNNPYLKEIEKLGSIKLFKGHESKNISNKIGAIVITSTVSKDNPELIEAQKLNIPIFERFEIINYILQRYKTNIGIFGGAGKTTTTSLTFFLFQSAGFLPSLFLGSVLKSLKSSVHLEKEGKVCIFETDESDASFEKMNMNGGIFVAMENDHLEHALYNGSYEKMQILFKNLLSKLKYNNSPISINVDSNDVVSLSAEILKGYTLQKSFSIIKKDADFYAENFRFEYQGMYFDIYKKGILFETNVFMPLIGKLNALNILGALCTLSFFTEEEKCKLALQNLKNFEGIDKRFSKVGRYKNFDIIDDYAHSPLKIQTMLSCFIEYAKAIDSEVIPICEIHKFSRFKRMYEEFKTCFNSCKLLILMDVYAVPGYQGEVVDINQFISDIKKINQNIEVIHVQNKDLARKLFEVTNNAEYQKQQNNFLLFFGAGISSKYAKEMQQSLEFIEIETKKS